MSKPLKISIVAIIVADLVALVYFIGLFLLTGSFLPAHGAHDDHIVVASVKEGATHTAKTEKVEKVFDYTTYVADVSKGEKIIGKCKACHTFNSGGANRTGPNLWDIYNQPIAAKDGFSYSSAFTSKQGEIVWNDKHLFAYLQNPRKYIEGTKMQFNGIKKPTEVADLIAYLKTLN